MATLTDRDALFRKRVKAFRRELKAVSAGSVDALHDARIAARRLREMLPLIAVDDIQRRTLARRLRKLTRTFGKVRELDVLLFLIEELEQSDRYPLGALRKIEAAITGACVAARERLNVAWPAPKLERLESNVRRAVLSTNDKRVQPKRVRLAERGWLWALEARLVRRAGELRSAIQSAGTLYAPAPLHAVRVAVKKLRYAIELSAEAAYSRRAATVAFLKAVQDELGRLHDLHILLLWTREAEASVDPPNLEEWRQLRALTHAIEQDARQLHAQYMRSRTALIALAERLGASPPGREDGRAAARR